MLAHLNKNYWYNPVYNEQKTVSFRLSTGVLRGRAYLASDQNVQALHTSNIVCYVSNDPNSSGLSVLTRFEDLPVASYSLLARISLTLVSPSGDVIHNQIPLTLLTSKKGRQFPISGVFDLNQSFLTFLDRSAIVANPTNVTLSFILNKNFQ